MKIYPKNPIVDFLKCQYEAEDKVTLQEIEEAIKTAMTEQLDMTLEEIYTPTRSQPQTLYRFMGWSIMKKLYIPGTPLIQFEGRFGGISRRSNIYTSIKTSDWQYDHYQWYRDTYDKLAERASELVSRFTTDGLDDNDLEVIRRAQFAHYESLASYDELMALAHTQKCRDYVRRILNHRHYVRQNTH